MQATVQKCSLLVNVRVKTQEIQNLAELYTRDISRLQILKSPLAAVPLK